MYCTNASRCLYFRLRTIDGAVNCNINCDNCLSFWSYALRFCNTLTDIYDIIFLLSFIRVELQLLHFLLFLSFFALFCPLLLLLFHLVYECDIKLVYLSPFLLFLLWRRRRQLRLGARLLEAIAHPKEFILVHVTERLPILFEFEQNGVDITVCVDARHWTEDFDDVFGRWAEPILQEGLLLWSEVYATDEIGAHEETCIVIKRDVFTVIAHVVPSRLILLLLFGE